MSNKNDHDIYIIPPNFIESGTFFGGMFRARNVIEAGIIPQSWESKTAPRSLSWKKSGFPNGLQSAKRA